jgi:hypothetical protein
VYRRESDKVVEVLIRELEVYSTPLLPGFQLPLAKLLALSDALEQAATDVGDDEEA